MTTWASGHEGAVHFAFKRGKAGQAKQVVGVANVVTNQAVVN